MSASSSSPSALKPGDVVTIKPEWLNPGETSEMLFIVVDEEDVVGGINIRPVESTMFIVPIERVPVATLNKVGVARFRIREKDAPKRFASYDMRVGAELVAAPGLAYTCESFEEANTNRAKFETVLKVPMLVEFYVKPVIR